MSGYKHSLWKILSAVAALALLLPRFALGEYGVCPPYSAAFGPGDPPEDILAFVNEVNVRPGGGTVTLAPGQYGDMGAVTITGVVCFDAGEGAGLPAELTVEYGALLTLRGVSTGPVVVQEAAVLMAEDAGIDPLTNAGSAFLRMTHLGRDNSSSNAGVLVMYGGSITHLPCDSFGCYGDVGLTNAGYALLDGVQVMRTQFDCKFCAGGTGVSNEAGGILSLVRSTIVDNGSCDWYGDAGCDGEGIHNNGGYVEIAQSIVADNQTDCTGDPVVDLGYNVFGPDGGCTATLPTSVEADPMFIPDPSWGSSPEIGAGSPAIDRIPYELGTPTDALGRARTDGNGDGTVDCDSGALEYGYASKDVVVRTTPYWRSVGRVDLSSTNALFVAVMSGGPIDPTSILFDSIAVGDFPSSAMRGISYADKNGDALADYVFWFRLDRALVLECRDYDEPFSATTDDGQQVTGRLEFEVVGCTG